MNAPSIWYQDDTQLLGALKSAAADRSPARLRPMIPGYDELHELGRGGQGVVFSATQRSTKRKVAVKILSDGAWASEGRRRRFEREVDLIAGLHHPNIVRLYDSGVTDAGFPYFVMEYIEGAGLDELVGAPAPEGASARAEPPLDVRVPVPQTGVFSLAAVRTTLPFFAKVCEAVNYAHQRGVIHRDLKPSNIRIDPTGEPFVLDFGLAKLAADSYDSPAAAPMSLTGEFMGSPPWASPEQASGHPHSTDVRSDVYALGVILFQLLTGKFPYPVAGGLRDVLDTIKNVEPQRPSSLRRELNDEIDTIVLKCLAKEPDRRYQTAGELARDLRHYLAGEPVEAKRDSALYTLRKTMRRYKYAARAASAVLVVSLGAAVWLSVLWLRATEAEQLAATRLEATEKARAAEAAALAEAQQEAAQTRAINEFLINMLTTPLDLGREARVADVLDKAAAELPQAAALEPATEAALREALGSAYASLGLYAEAAPQLQKAAALWRQLEGDEGPGALTTRAHVAWLLRQTGKLDESEALFRQVLAGRRRVLGADHLDTARTMNDLACVLEIQGKLEEAEELHRAALANLRQRLGDDALDTISSIGNLASVLSSQGKLDEAEALLQERLERARRVLGINHRDTLRAMSSYSWLLGMKGRYAEALALSREVYDGHRRLVGEDHPETITALANLAVAYSSLGRSEEAEPLLREVLERARRVLGPEHPDTLTALNMLAGVLKTRGRYAEAEPLLREALAGSRQARGEDHVDTLYAMNNLAQCLQLQEKRRPAEELYRAALAGCRRTLGEENPYTLTAMLNLGAVLVEAGQFEEAEPLLRHVLDTRRKLFGEEQIDTLHAELQLATLEYERGAFEKAREMLEPLLEKVQRALPAEHWYPGVVQGLYGRTLLALRQYAVAEQQLLEAYARLQTTLGDEHPRTQKLRGRLVELYEAWGKPDQAERYRTAAPTSSESPASD
jgi:serine/threonine protein kinase/predicted negative regulator of RcsB-dependent stress response